MVSGEFAEILKKELKEKGWSQLHFAEEVMSVNRKSVESWIKGNVPKIDYLLQMCDLFQCDLDYLLGRQKEKTKAVTDICEVTGLSAEAVVRMLANKADGYGFWTGFLSHLITQESFDEIIHRVLLSSISFSYIKELKKHGVYERLKKIFIRSKPDYKTGFGLLGETIKYVHEDDFIHELEKGIENGVFSKGEIKWLKLENRFEYLDGKRLFVEGIGYSKLFKTFSDEEDMQQVYWMISNSFVDITKSYLQSIDITEERVIKTTNFDWKESL